jgi:hypothetical protein
MNKLALIVILLGLGCSKSNEDKAKEVGKNVEAKAKELGQKVEVEAKKDEKLAEKKVAIGAPVDFAAGMQVLCDALPDDGKTRTPTEQAELVRVALEQHPNPEVLKLMGAMATITPADRPAKFQESLTRANIKSCKFYDLTLAKK